MLNVTEETLSKMLDLIIFDCDGVLVDSEILSIEVLHDLILKQGGNLTKEDVIQQFQGRSMKSARDELSASQGVELTDASITEMNEYLFARFQQELQPVLGITAFIESLNLPYCVASSSHPERIDASLTATNLRHYFSGKVFSSTMVKNGKPAPDLFLLAAEKMAFSAERVLVIEDSPAGVQAARNAGMLSIGLTAGSHAKHPNHRKRLIDAGANWVVNSYDEVAKIIWTLS
ncbi:HAD family hydrolase [Marinomonas sp. RSW2]|uniref:HAD family hydrolase n=1 Tax=Marinomonas maritima TaxID=2940935 RepID=A0ABT5WF77_9GAMM|nr:HAD family hydrolase [Marinomonas maritima]MDE8603014.1 HAD family hydrolase [Marinomonas maritima]